MPSHQLTVFQLLYDGLHCLKSVSGFTHKYLDNFKGTYNFTTFKKEQKQQVSMLSYTMWPIQGLYLGPVNPQTTERLNFIHYTPITKHIITSYTKPSCWHQCVVGVEAVNLRKPTCST